LFRSKKYFPVIAVIVILGLFFFHDLLHITSSNAVVYFVKTPNGFLSVTRDLSLENAGDLLFMFDATCLINWLLHAESAATGKPLLDVTWNEDTGRGGIKQFRPDGTKLVVTFSRFQDGGKKAGGLFLGGDLAYGDYDRSADGATSGMSYYDGRKWNHIWCAANEGFTLHSNDRKAYNAYEWHYLSGRVLKRTDDEVIIQSRHMLQEGDEKVLMNRWVSMKAGDDHLKLNIEFENKGKAKITYNYDYGDEPWVGEFHNSRGDVGWSEKGLITHERFISPRENRYAGYWDHGNDAAGEKHSYSGYANFIRWPGMHPSVVYFSNNFESCSEEKPLSSYNNRVINIGWLSQTLLPGERRTYTLIIGKASINPGTGLPEAPHMKDGYSYE